MNRIALVNYRGVGLTPDTIEALKTVEKEAIKKGHWLFELKASPFKESGLSKAGREIHLRLSRPDITSRQVELKALWGIAVPLGFTPFLRHCSPTDQPQDFVFHYNGPWQTVYDRLLAEGRGHLSWDSLTCAALSDVGLCTQNKEVERFLQTQLHRVGQNIGPIDGIIGPRTTAALGRLMLKGNLTAVAHKLVHLETSLNIPHKSRKGHIILPGHKILVRAYGKTSASAMGQNGAILTATGQGRFIIEVS